MFKIMQTPNNGNGGKTNELPGIDGPGVAPVSIPEIDVLVEKYVALRDKRMEQLRLEVEAKHALIAALRENVGKITPSSDGSIVYRHDDLIVTLKTGKDELKVKTIGGEEKDED